MSFDALQDQIRALKSPIAVELGDIPAYFPEKSAVAQSSAEPEREAQAVYQFHTELIHTFSGLVPAVIFRPAAYERLGWRGWRAMEQAIQYASDRGLFVIADIRRGESGADAAACAQFWLGSVRADCVTLNGYLGSDAIVPFLNAAKETDKSVLVLVKTPNSSAGELQELLAGDRQVYQAVGDLTERAAKGTEDKYGYTRAGAMIGTAYPSDIRELRRRLPHTFFLISGYVGRGDAEKLRYAFDSYGHGALAVASWQLLFRQTTEQFARAARETVAAMREELLRYVTIV